MIPLRPAVLKAGGGRPRQPGALPVTAGRASPPHRLTALGSDWTRAGSWSRAGGAGRCVNRGFGADRDR